MKIETVSEVERALGTKHRPDKGRIEHGAGNGLELWVRPDGPGEWRFRYRPRGMDVETGKRHPTRTMHIGTTVTHAFRKARNVAALLQLRVANGDDPVHDDRAARERSRADAAEAARQRQIEIAGRSTCRERLAEYGAVLASRGRSAKHQKEELAQVRLALTSLDLIDAAPGDITVAHVEKIMAICPPGSQALRFGALDRFMRWSLRKHGATIPTAQFDKHEKPKLPPPRQRVLAPAELRAVWTAAAALETPVLQDLVRFLMSIPCRESEAASMRWMDLDLTARVWTMPTSKNRMPHRFPLTDRAVSVLERRRAAAGEAAHGATLVFAAPKSGKAFVAWSVLKRTLDRRLDPTDNLGVVDTPVDAWRFHDLRRTGATAMGEAGLDEGLIDLVLNHAASRSRGGIVGTYNLSQRWNERVKALGAWGAALSQAIDGDTGHGIRDRDTQGEIVPFPASRLAGALA